jgi:hypothetical protein
VVAQVLVLVGVAAIIALALVLLLQLWFYLPRDWRTARLGRIISFTLAGVGGWLVSWLSLALGLALARSAWGFVPRRPTVLIINYALVFSLVAILAVANTALWRWQRGVKRPPKLEPRGVIPDD